MTKYFLHGGRVSRVSPENTHFFESLLSEIKGDTIRILLVQFARKKSVWEEKSRETETRFQAVNESKKLLGFDTADENRDSLRDQIQSSDIIFLHGGETLKLQQKLEEIPDLEKLLSGKVVAGSSAGALVFSKYYYENDTDSYHVGLGFLDVKCICHWNDQEIQAQKLEAFGENTLEILRIPEGHFFVLDK